MENVVKQQVLELLKTLNEGIGYVEHSKKGKKEIKSQVLQDCLACILPIRNALFSYGNKIEPILILLDEIKVNMNKIQGLLDRGQALGTIPFIIRKQILKVCEFVKSTKRRQIVFLPYKASMWDSLESIWRAAENDKSCDAYVIPIPYCDRNPDGSASTWHYEGDEFPSDVPIIDWKKYDLEEQKPDVVYIHNPYDDCNLVTSVHPHFYSNELKKYTDMLIYVPYFVAGEAISEHFAKTPGILNADKVIVESEKIKSQYETYYPGGNPPKDKFLALGSPKFDKVRNSKREDYDLPEEWMKLIKGKKVVLYNTTISAMLENADKFIEKIRYVFSIFQERNDIVLWWRPHPLLKSTIKTMLPQLLSEYEQILQDYKKSGWGIYDDSADLNRSIACTDAYYGDMSSVVWLYNATGKPVMIQNMDILSEYDCPLDMSDIEIENNKAWFISREINALFVLDFETEKVKLIHILSHEKIFADQEYRKIIKIGEKIIIAPFFSKGELIEYDLKSNTLTKIFLKKRDAFLIEKDMGNEIAFYDIIKYHKKIYLIGCGYPAIVEYDVDTRECKYYTDYIKKLEKLSFSENMGIFANAKIQDNCLLLPFLQGNIVVEFNMATKSFKYNEVGDKSNRYWKIELDGEFVWLSQHGGAGLPLIRWDYRSGKSTRHESYPEKCDFSRCMNGYTGFVDMVSINGKLNMFPDMANIVVEVDLNNGDMTENQKLSEIIHNKVMNFKWFLFAYKKGNNVYAFLNNESVLIKIFSDKNDIKKYKIRLSREDAKKIRSYNSHRSTNGLWKELILHSDLDYLINDSLNPKSMKKENDCGTKVIDFMRFK